MSDSAIGFLVEDCVNYVLEGFDDANVEGCQIAQAHQSELAWEVFMQSWLSKPLTKLAQQAYDIGASESSDQPMNEVEELRKHLKAFAGFAATCRRENSYEWMVMMLDWLNGVCGRVSPESYFILDGHEFKVVDHLGKEQGT